MPPPFGLKPVPFVNCDAILPLLVGLVFTVVFCVPDAVLSLRCRSRVLCLWCTKLLQKNTIYKMRLMHFCHCKYKIE